MNISNRMIIVRTAFQIRRGAILVARNRIRNRKSVARFLARMVMSQYLPQAPLAFARPPFEARNGVRRRRNLRGRGAHARSLSPALAGPHLGGRYFGSMSVCAV